MSYGEAIRRLRQARGWKQEELARRTGIQQATISQVERGIRDNPTAETLQRLADAFGISVPDLLREAGVSMRARPDLPASVAELGDLGVPIEELEELAAIWSGLTPNERDAMLAAMRAMQERHNRRAPESAPQQPHGAKPALH